MSETPETPIYQGKMISVFQIFQENRRGGMSQYDWVVHPGAVAILPFVDEETILLISNDRFAVGETLFEIPAGVLEKNESPDQTARRELREETGYIANQWDYLFSHYPSPGFCNERIFCFAAQDLLWRGQQLEDSENINVHPTTFQNAIEMVASGEIIDGKTVATLLYWDRFYR